MSAVETEIMTGVNGQELNTIEVLLADQLRTVLQYAGQIATEAAVDGDPKSQRIRVEMFTRLANIVNEITRLSDLSADLKIYDVTHAVADEAENVSVFAPVLPVHANGNGTVHTPEIIRIEPNVPSESFDDAGHGSSTEAEPEVELTDEVTEETNTTPESAMEVDVYEIIDFNGNAVTIEIMAEHILLQDRAINLKELALMLLKSMVNRVGEPLMRKDFAATLDDFYDNRPDLSKKDSARNQLFADAMLSLLKALNTSQMQLFKRLGERSETTYYFGSKNHAQTNDTSATEAHDLDQYEDDDDGRAGSGFEDTVDYVELEALDERESVIITPKPEANKPVSIDFRNGYELWAGAYKILDHLKIYRRSFTTIQLANDFFVNPLLKDLRQLRHSLDDLTVHGLLTISEVMRTDDKNKKYAYTINPDFPVPDEVKTFDVDGSLIKFGPSAYRIIERLYAAEEGIKVAEIAQHIYGTPAGERIDDDYSQINSLIKGPLYNLGFVIKSEKEGAYFELTPEMREALDASGVVVSPLSAASEVASITEVDDYEHEKSGALVEAEAITDQNVPADVVTTDAMPQSELSEVTAIGTEPVTRLYGNCLVTNDDVMIFNAGEAKVLASFRGRESMPILESELIKELFGNTSPDSKMSFTIITENLFKKLIDAGYMVVQPKRYGVEYTVYGDLTQTL